MQADNWQPRNLHTDALASLEKFTLGAIPAHVKCAGCDTTLQSKARRPLCGDCIRKKIRRREAA